MAETSDILIAAVVLGGSYLVLREVQATGRGIGEAITSIEQAPAQAVGGSVNFLSDLGNSLSWLNPFNAGPTVTNWLFGMQKQQVYTPSPVAPAPLTWAQIDDLRRLRSGDLSGLRFA